MVPRPARLPVLLVAVAVVAALTLFGGPGRSSAAPAPTAAPARTPATRTRAAPSRRPLPGGRAPARTVTTCPAPPPVPAAATTRPLLDVVGASFSAGVGAPRGRAWPQQLAGFLHWRVDVSADPGAGYLALGYLHRGPMLGLAERLPWPKQPPAVVLVQSGHNDIGHPTAELRRAVEHLVGYLRRVAPDARIGVVTVFATGSRPTPAAWAADRAIVAGARQADPAVLVFDPLAHHWSFPRIRDHLHPSRAGHHWIAIRLAGDLHRRIGVPVATCASRSASHAGHNGPKLAEFRP